MTHETQFEPPPVADAAAQPRAKIFRFRLRTLLIGLALVSVLLAVGTTWLRNIQRASACRTNLARLGVALLNYELNHGSYPPAWTTDAQGRPETSWRELVAPYANEIGAYDPRLPWDAPENQAAARAMTRRLTCADDTSTGATSYVAVVADGFAFQGSRASTIRDIQDGTSNTILLIEIADSGIPWHEPRDLTWQEFVDRYTRRSLGGHANGFHALMCDGSVRHVRYGEDPAFIRKMFTAGGVELIDVNRASSYKAP